MKKYNITANINMNEAQFRELEERANIYEETVEQLITNILVDNLDNWAPWKDHSLNGAINVKVEKSDTPIFKHDCEFCTFLGTFDGHDLYHCNKPMLTLIARFGNEGPEYKSGISYIAVDKHITEAYNRAIKQNLLCRSI